MSDQFEERERRFLDTIVSQYLKDSLEKGQQRDSLSERLQSCRFTLVESPPASGGMTTVTAWTPSGRLITVEVG